MQPNLGYGIDFNPNADYNGWQLAAPGQLGWQQLRHQRRHRCRRQQRGCRHDRPGFTAVAYTNSAVTNSALASAPSTSLYYIDSNSDSLKFAASGFNSPTITTVGALNVDVLKANGFDIAADGMGYAALNVDDGTSLATGIYSINLGNGNATLLGTYNGTLSGLTVSAVPEPQTVAMMLAGLLAVGALARRRRV